MWDLALVLAMNENEEKVTFRVPQHNLVVKEWVAEQRAAGNDISKTLRSYISDIADYPENFDKLADKVMSTENGLPDLSKLTMKEYHMFIDMLRRAQWFMTFVVDLEKSYNGPFIDTMVKILERETDEYKQKKLVFES